MVMVVDFISQEIGFPLSWIMWRKQDYKFWQGKHNEISESKDFEKEFVKDKSTNSKPLLLFFFFFPKETYPIACWEFIGIPGPPERKYRRVLREDTTIAENQNKSLPSVCTVPQVPDPKITGSWESALGTHGTGLPCFYTLPLCLLSVTDGARIIVWTRCLIQSCYVWLVWVCLVGF